MTVGHARPRTPQWADYRAAGCWLRLGLQGQPVPQPGGRPVGRALRRAVVEGGQRLGLELVAARSSAAVAVGIATGLLVERFFVGPVRRKTKAPVRLLILTIGVSQVLLALTYIPGLTPTSQAPFPQPFTSHLQIGGVVLSGMSVLTMILVPVLLVLLMGVPRIQLGRQADPSGSGQSRCGAAVRNLGEPGQHGHLGDRRRALGLCCGTEWPDHDLVQCGRRPARIC